MHQHRRLRRLAGVSDPERGESKGPPPVRPARHCRAWTLKLAADSREWTGMATAETLRLRRSEPPG